MVHKSYMEICNTKNFKSMQDELKETSLTFLLSTEKVLGKQKSKQQLRFFFFFFFYVFWIKIPFDLS